MDNIPNLVIHLLNQLNSCLVTGQTIQTRQHIHLAHLRNATIELMLLTTGSSTPVLFA